MSAGLEQKIEKAAKKVFAALGPSLPESFYQRALAFELGCLSMEAPCPVYYGEKLVGTCDVDIIDYATGFLIECKTIIAAPIEGGKEAGQCGAYMRHLGIEFGAVINFGWVRGTPDILFVYSKKEENNVT